MILFNFNKKTLAIAFPLLTILSSYAQDWNLVWSDEFTTEIGSEWVFETGTGIDGWGNNELQYYRAENAGVENGELVITAKKETIGNSAYTSARMITRGNASWRYGKMEARIKLPSFMGAWPAFWMLGDNIGSVGWPNCGEIDIMEHVNDEPEVHGTIHYSNANSDYNHVGNSLNIDVTEYHLYSVEWNQSSIKWFVDGIQYHEVNILNDFDGRSEFHNNFFLILNLAIGGRWPGFNVDDSAFPAKMFVDYVRVYQAADGLPQGETGLTGIHYLKNRGSNKYLSVELASENDGANIEQADFTGKDNQKFLFREVSYGKYAMINFNSDKVLDVSNSDTINGTNVHQWENSNSSNQRFFITKTAEGYYKIVDVNSGKILATASSSNNIQIEKDENQESGQWQIESTGYFFIEAESYSANNKVIKERTTDEYGGQNVGALDIGNWVSYGDAITIPANGKYLVEYRVASFLGDGRLTADLNGGDIILGSLDLPNTGDWQNWTTISHVVDLNAGTFDFGVYSNESGWNLNWIQITPADVITSTKGNIVKRQALYLSPNPVLNTFKIYAEVVLQADQIEIFNTLGVKMNFQYLGNNQVDVHVLEPGVYVLNITNSENKSVNKFLKR